MITVCCVWQRSRLYDERYPARLKNAVERHLGVPHRFVCLTGEYLPEMECVPPPAGLSGWWLKLGLFHPDMLDVLGDDCLYFDLDTVILGDITPIVEIPGSFVAYQSRNKRADGHYRLSSAIMRWRGDHSRIWTFYETEGDKYDLSKDDQTLIWLGLGKEWVSMNEHLPPYFLREWMYDQLGGFREGTILKLYPDLRVICFGGEPKPHQVVEGSKLIRENWV
jgi:hypothetical protein